ncbi:MAG TPA: hypothetical protein VIJ68_03040 [Candidatus Saccharimonadales bacterium]
MNARQRKALNASLERGLAYLAAVQRSDGGFDSFSSPSATHFVKEVTYRTTFAPALILASLSGLPVASSRGLKRRLASFVTKQKSPLESFNYWAKSSPERQRQPYPDDLDDTCCALIGLTLHDRTAIGPDTLASLVKLLLATETQPGGPYRTWLKTADGSAAWQDVDLAVNANVAYLLSLVSQPLPGLTAFMEAAIRDEQLSSPYYPSSYSIIYFLARAYDGPLKADLHALARQLQHTPTSQTPLDLALLLSSLARLGETDRAQLQLIAGQLLAAQQADGSWPAAAFCLDPVRNGVSYYNGSESLTTAFALEALQLYNEYSFATSKVGTKPGQGSFSRRDLAFDDKILKSVRLDCHQLAPDLRRTTVQFLEKIVRSDSGAEIVSLPLRFTRSLTTSPARPPLLAHLGAANLYGWAAYTLFDDFLDEEGKAEQLPVAITSLRYSLAAFEQALPDDPVFRRVVRQTFDTIDSANAWEISHCRFERSGEYLLVEALPDYGEVASLADRSLGHSLTPLAVLKAQGVDPDAKLFRGVRQVMIHYLAARQLNDDAHDWQTDLQKGHITYVVAQILADSGIKPGRHAADALLKRCQQQFWYHTLPEICRLIQRQTILSRRSLGALPDIRPQNTFTELLDGIDATVADTLTAQSDAEAFLKHFKASGWQASTV